MNELISIMTGLEVIYKTPLLSNLKRVLSKYPDVKFEDAFSQGQLESKLWLINMLSKIQPDLGTVFILGGWYGILPALMFESDKFEIEKIRSFDIDPSCADIADTMNRTPFVLEDWMFKASTADMYDLNYNITNYITKRANGTDVDLMDSPDTIINTSCEHLEKFSDWWDRIPQGKFVVLQSNNFFSAKGHVNCVDDINKFLQKTNFAKILYSGKLELEKYTRFMIIGMK